MKYYRNILNFFWHEKNIYSKQFKIPIQQDTTIIDDFTFFEKFSSPEPLDPNLDPKLFRNAG